MATKITRDVLESYLRCKTKAHLKLTGQQGTRSDYEGLLTESRGQVRLAVIDKILSGNEEGDVVRNIPLTVSALKAGPSFVLDATVEDDQMSLHLDGLKKVDGASKLGDFHYVPMLFQEGCQVRKEQRVMLSIYGLLLARLQNVEPRYGILWHGKECAATRVKLSPHEAGQVLLGLQEISDSSSPPELMLNDHCRICEFQSRCLAKVTEADSLTLLDRMTPKLIKRYKRRGIFTVTQLSYLFRPRRRKAKQKGGKGFKVELQAFAIRTGQTFLQMAPQLTRSRPGLFMDVEGAPDEDFSYLVGLMVLDGNVASYFPFWADNAQDEKDAWIGALGKIRQFPGSPVYHYGSYDRKATERAGKRHELACDDVLARMVNITSHIYGRIYFPVRSNSLKDIGKFVGAVWTSQDASGLQCLCWRKRWEATHDVELKGRILRYNEEDCVALRLITDRLSNLKEAVTQANSPGVEFAQRPRRQATDSGRHLHDKFEEIIKFAHFNYQKTRILLRPDKPGEPPEATQPEKMKQRIFRRIPPTKSTRVIKVRRRTKCPRHKVRLTKTDVMAERIISDLVFTKNGCRKTYIKYVGAKAHCKTCGWDYIPKGIFKICKSALGYGFQAWVTYQRVALRQPYEAITTMMEDMFEETISTSTATSFVTSVACRYTPAEATLLRRMLDSPFIHVDDTKVNIQGENHYVWGFTDGTRVVFRMTATREANIVHELLKGYGGVMVSDFYPGFDSVACRQQKCLIHLVRDINDELWSNPFDSQLEAFATAVKGLLVPILQDVQRYGLKARHLRKHKAAVDGFYHKEVEPGRYTSDVVVRFTTRFQRYRDSMFLFLEDDSIPWNNNTGERALRHIAVQRKISGSFFKSFASRYLILLGIAQTCKFQEKSFLKFLLSGEMDVDLFRPRRPRRKTRPSGNRQRSDQQQGQRPKWPGCPLRQALGAQAPRRGQWTRSRFGLKPAGVAKLAAG
jgi:predicted RecB family nuclease